MPLREKSSSAPWLVQSKVKSKSEASRILEEKMGKALKDFSRNELVFAGDWWLLTFGYHHVSIKRVSSFISQLILRNELEPNFFEKRVFERKVERRRLQKFEGASGA